MDTRTIDYKGRLQIDGEPEEIYEAYTIPGKMLISKSPCIRQHFAEILADVPMQDFKRYNSACFKELRADGQGRVNLSKILAKAGFERKRKVNLTRRHDLILVKKSE